MVHALVGFMMVILDEIHLGKEQDIAVRCRQRKSIVKERLDDQ